VTPGGEARLFIDTDVLISAVVFGGVPGRLIEAIRAGRAVGVVSLHVLGEFVEVLTRPKFGFDTEVAVQLAEEISAFITVVPIVSATGHWVTDGGDDAVVEAAIVGRATHLVSGDSCVCAVQTQAVQVVSAAEAIALLEEGESIG
jgi:putative PIN family toxin of toxin-antitoxin system